MLRPVFLLVVFLLIAIEGGVLAWRHAGTQPSTAPVFYWQGAPLLTSAPPPFGTALEMYRADRGAQLNKELAEGRKMTFFYFEWDGIDLGPFCDVGGHEAEVCNVAAGFKVLKSGVQRTHTLPGGESLTFDYTLLAEPNGKPVHIYKIRWIQGYGAWLATHSSLDRPLRIRRSLLCHRGAARVLEAGIFGAANEDEAWALFEREVLEMLVWRR